MVENMRNFMKINKYLIILALLSSISVFGQNVKFIASVNSNEVAVGQRFQISFSLENAQGSNFKAPSFKGFSVVFGPSQSQRTQIINGQMSSSISYSYNLQADVAGKFTIGPASIVVDGKQINSNPVTINVVQGTPQQKQQNQTEQNTNQQAKDIIRKNLFVNLNVSKKDVYQGEIGRASCRERV